MTKEQLRKSWRRSFTIALTAAMVVNSAVPGTVAYAAEFTAPDSANEIVQEDAPQAEPADMFGDEEPVEAFSDNSAESYAANEAISGDLTEVTRGKALEWWSKLPTENLAYKAGEGTVTWDASERKLTFNNATIKCKRMSANGGIQLCGDVTVELIGENQFINNISDDDKKYTTAVFFSVNKNGKLTFTGSGDLTMTSGGRAFNTSSGAQLIFNNTGSISAEIKQEGIQAQGNVILNDGTLKFDLYGSDNIRGIDQYANCKFIMNGGNLKINYLQNEISSALSGGIIPIGDAKTCFVEIHGGTVDMDVIGDGIASANEVVIDGGAKLNITARKKSSDAIRSNKVKISNAEVVVSSENGAGIQNLKEVSGNVSITAIGKTFGVGWYNKGQDCTISGKPVIVSRGATYGGFSRGSFGNYKDALTNYKLTVNKDINADNGESWNRSDDLEVYKYIKLEYCEHTNAEDDGNCTTPVICPDCGITTVEAYDEHEYGEWQENDEKKWCQCIHPGCTQTKEIKKAGTLVTVESYSGEYDGKNHGITITPLEGNEDVKITYVTSNEYKDVTNGAQTVQYKIEKEGYEPTIGEATVEITPRTVELNWGASEFVYNGENQVPVATVGNLVDNEVCTVAVEGAKCDANNSETPVYTATATGLEGESSANYKLPESDKCTHEFKISPKNITEEMAVINTSSDPAKGFETIISDNIGGQKVYLEENTDYTISVEKDNDKYSITINGTGNYTGQIKKSIASIERPADGNITSAVIINPNVEELAPSLNPISGDKAESIFMENLSDNEDAKIIEIVKNKPEDSSYNATIYLQVEAKDESEIAGDVEKIKAFVIDRSSNIPSDAKIGEYLDLSLFMTYVAKDNNGTYSGTKKINDLKNNVQYVTISIPDDLKQTKANTVRRYYMIRVHGDETKAVQCTQNGNTLTFLADKFSTYAIAYKDTYYAPSYPVTGVTVSSDKTTLTKEGETTQITATVTPSYADNKNVTWKSSDEKVATVDKNGKVTAVGNGTVTITATTADGKYSATTTIIVKIAPEKLTLEAEKTTLTKIGDSLQITAKVEPDNAYKKLIWKSSDEKVAIVDADGKVTAVGTGTATITATTEDGKLTESVTITVKIPDEPTVNETTGYGRLKARSVTQTNNSIKLEWTRVSGADGYIIYGNYCNGNGKTYKYNKITTITNGKTRTWTHTKLKKATYYKYIVKAYKLVDGKKVITDTSVSVHATTTGGKYGVAKAVSITKIGSKKNVREVTLKRGKTTQITAKEIKKDRPIKHHRNICYESSNAKVATVTPDGVIQATGKGTCTIWVYAQNGVYKTVTVTVK